MSHSKYHPEESAGFLSRFFFSWVGPLVRQGAQVPLIDKDLYPLCERDSSLREGRLFRLQFHLRRRFSRPALRTLGAIHAKSLGLVTSLYAIHIIFSVSSPLMVKKILGVVSDASQPWTAGLMWAAALFAVELISGFSIHHTYHKILRAGMRVRAGLVNAIYNKSLRLTPEARLKNSMGEMVNLMNSDAARIYNAANMVYQIWMFPLHLLVVIALLWVLIGPSSLAGVITMVVMLSLTLWRSRKVQAFRKKLIEMADSRMTLVSEVISGMKIIKLHAWEEGFRSFVLAIRNQEYEVLRKLSKETAFYILMFLSTPIFVGLSTFSALALSGRPMNMPDIFAALGLFALLRQLMGGLPFIISGILDANVGLKRIESFLNAEELVDDEAHELPKGTVCLKNLDAAWAEKDIILEDIDLQIKPGEFLVIVGEYGSGKSSLLNAILGEMNTVRGARCVSGKVAWVPQQAWILNNSLRENILFGKSLCPETYKKALHSCALIPDLQLLPASDMTEIGERGVNLSGGQKQRINLCRAVYSDADIYLLDDPLSAVDNIVGKHIAHHVLQEQLKDKTRVLVTHRLEYVRLAHRVAVMEHGKIIEIGALSDLIAPCAQGQSPGRLRTMLAEYFQDEHFEERLHLEDEHNGQLIPFDAEHISLEVESGSVERGKIILDEERYTGAVSGAIFKAYVSAMVTPAGAALILFAFLLREALGAGNDWWLATWSRGHALASEDVQRFLTGFAALGLGAAATAWVRTYLLSLSSVRAARHMHDNLLNGVLSAPMSFFESTPLGRILNRFGKDTENIDQFIPPNMMDFLNCMFTVVSTILVVVLSSPLTLLAVGPAGLFYWWVQKTYRVSSREVKRLESMTRSPVYAQFAETLGGTPVIRAFRQQRSFEKKSLQCFEGNQRSFYTMISLNRWLGVRIVGIGVFSMTSTALLAVAMRGTLNPDLGAMALTYSLLVVGVLNWGVRTISEFESSMNAVERVKHYAELQSENWDGREPASPTWPESGRLAFHHFSVTYRAGLEPVLKNLNLSIAPGEKIGIVGRTGAGKSSLILSLFRIMEAQAGRIEVDGEDISKIPLKTLRQRLSIIPQEPTLFAGTLRRNLSPLGTKSDSDLVNALKKAGLDDFLDSLPLGLDAPILEGGQNLSVGQRQLVCLSRALLQSSPILVLDEATANLDYATDQLLQNVIRREFASSTVLIIAHRIKTVLDCDRVLVLEKGEVAEFGPPLDLMRCGGIFSELCAEAGVEWSDEGDLEQSLAANCHVHAEVEAIR